MTTVAEVRRRGSKDLLKVCVLLDRGQREGKREEGKPLPLNIYDTPYEGELDGDREGVWIPVTRPESDVRPAGEYELPWEWRKEDIVRALSGREHKRGMMMRGWREDATRLFAKALNSEDEVKQPSSIQMSLY